LFIYFVCSMRVTCPAHCLYLNVIILIIITEGIFI
jgi:hypothetical protein